MIRSVVENWTGSIDCDDRELIYFSCKVTFLGEATSTEFDHLKKFLESMLNNAAGFKAVQAALYWFLWCWPLLAL